MKIDSLGVTLYPWQKEALDWMSSQEDGLCRGGLLCDEMGLGKTIEAMALVATKPVNHTLIIVPPILMHQWLVWIKKIDPAVRVYENRPRDDHQWDLELGLLQKPTIVLTGFTKLLGSRSIRVRNNLTGLRKDRSPIHDIVWDRIIVDECHYLQSPTSQRTQAVLALRGECRWGLTGTPFAKSPHQMSSLMRFLRWREGDLTGIKYHQDMNDIVLSRRIKDINVLKKKMANLDETLHHIDFSRDEANFYFSLKGHLRERWLVDKRMRLPRWIRAKNHLLTQSLLQLASIHPELVFERWRQWIDTGKYNEQWTENQQETAAIFDQHWDNPDSSKMLAIDRILRVNLKTGLRNEQRSLIFLPYRLHLDFMESWLRQKGYSVSRLDGTVKPSTRARMLDSLTVTPYYMSRLCSKNNLPYLPPEIWRMIGTWSGNPQILLLQNRVGGVGLNLQSFSQVIFPIPMSTPSLESQAIARSYRLGQKNNVHIHRIALKAGVEDAFINEKGAKIIPQTLDERQLELASEKRKRINQWWDGKLEYEKEDKDE